MITILMFGGWLPSLLIKWHVYIRSFNGVEFGRYFSNTICKNIENNAYLIVRTVFPVLYLIYQKEMWYSMAGWRM